MRAIRGLLRPGWSEALLLSVFVLVVVGGWIQSWGFAEPPLPPKPFLYDFLAPLPFWPIWMITLVPLALLTSPLRFVGVDVMAAPPWLFLPLSFLYYYLISYFMVLVVRSSRAAIRRMRHGLPSEDAAA